mgnify:CR=1 FL=1|tara:strand:- start:962 stop:1447 length:486 start_codon:yes stop_codon:yes gene_type:complete
MVKLKDMIKDLELGKVYTDKDRPPFKVESVVEAITRRGFMEIKGQAKYLMDSAKNLMRAIKNQNDLTTKEEVEYIHSKSKLMMDLLKDKRYNESVNELTTNQVIATQVMVAMQRCDKIIKDLIKNDVAKRDKKKALELMKLYKKHFVEFSAKAKAANPLED